MEMEWETRPLSIVHRTRDWHSSINRRNPVAGSSTSTVTISGSSLSTRRRSSVVNAPPLGPPPTQPIPSLPPMPESTTYGDSEDEFQHNDDENDYTPAVSDDGPGSSDHYQRPVGSSSLAAVAAFSLRNANASSSSPPPSFSRASRNLSDSPPRSLLPHSARQPLQTSQEIVPSRLLLSPPEPRSPGHSRPSSRRALTKALELAREAVRLDSTNDDPYGAIKAYGQSVALLSEVMERVMRGEDSTEQGGRRRSGRRRSIVAQEEEVRRLKSIHDTYADRMNILSLIYSIPPVPYSPSAEFMRFSAEQTPSPLSTSPSSDSSGLPQSSGSTEADQSEYQSSTDDGGTSIGSAMFTLDTSRRSSSTSSSPTITATIAPLPRSQSREQLGKDSMTINSTNIGMRMSMVPPPRPPPAGPPPIPPPGRSRASSVLPPQPPPPSISPPLTPTIVEPDQPSPRRHSHFTTEFTRSRGSSTSHVRTGSSSRLAALQEEGDSTQSRHRRPSDAESNSSSSIAYLAPRSNVKRESPPLPPLPSPATSDSAYTPRVSNNEAGRSHSPPFPTPRPRGSSVATHLKSSTEPGGQQLLINNSIAGGTIHQRRNKTSTPAPAETPIAELNGIGNQARLTASSLPASTAMSLGIGRHRAASQPIRPSVMGGQASQSDLSIRPNAPNSAAPRKLSYNLRLPIPPSAPQSEFLSPSLGSSATALLPPPPVLPGQLPTTPTSPLPPAAPNDPLRKPYHLMTLLRHTMLSKSGGYITRRLHVPCEVWSQGGAKLNNLPEKVRVVEVLCDALVEMQNASVEFCGPMGPATGMGLGIGSVGRREGELWGSKLEEFSSVCDGVVGNFSKKLGVGEGFVVKKSGGMTSWGGKFARQFDKLTNGKNLDSPASYVQGLMRLFELAQLLDEHTKALSSQPMAPTYSALPGDLRSTLELKFKRSSEFFASVVLTFVIRDLSQLLDKYAKKCEKWLAE